MTYEINNTKLIALCDETISRVASRAYDEQGNSLYDGIRITSGDMPEIKRLIGDALRAMVIRLVDVATIIEPEGEEGETPNLELVIDVPDMDQLQEDRARAEIDRFIPYFVAWQWFTQKYKDGVEEYQGKANYSLSSLVILVKTRKAPTR